MAIATTISDLIELESEKDISHKTLNNDLYIYDHKLERTILLPFNALINKYKDYFSDYIVHIELTEEEKNVFRYSPKKMSLAQYGTTGYWSLILYINDCASVLDFDPDYVALIPRNKLEEMISDLIIMDKDE